LIEKIFVYGTLLERPRRELVIPNVKVLDIKPAFINAKMYSAYKRYPIAIFPNQGKKAMAPCMVYGGLLTVEMNSQDWYGLDSYEGCSRAMLGKNHDSDLYHRHHTRVKTFTFDDMMSFTRFDINVDKQETTAWAYFGNVLNPFVKNIIWDGHNRAGHIWKSFFGAFGESSD
jgi:gamma-glutamylcyclotransferase (GGCT)/AIG2-like uncharacterized protein YtfP